MTHQSMIDYERRSRANIAARKAQSTGPRCKAPGCTEPARKRKGAGNHPAYCIEHAEEYRKRYAALANARMRQARRERKARAASEGAEA